MPIQRIVIPKFAEALWAAVQKNPVSMTKKCLKARACQALLKTGLVEYRGGKLRLICDDSIE